jgi:hypothetical protein
VFNRGFNRKVLIAEDKKARKLAFDVLAAFYRRKAAGRTRNSTDTAD